VCDPPTKTDASLRLKTILVVDDVAEVLELVAEILADLGYDVVCTSDGARALKILRDGRRFDLLFTDVMMPGLHGFELAQRAKAMEPSLRVIYLSGYSAMLPEDVETFGPVLRKPFRANELRAAVRQEMGD
jgi:CheY-like chemotaxis protein